MASSVGERSGALGSPRRPRPAPRQHSVSARITYVVDSNYRISYITPDDKQYQSGPIWRQVGVPTLCKIAPNGAYAKADGVTTIGYDNKCYKSVRAGPINFSAWKATAATDCPGLTAPR